MIHSVMMVLWMSHHVCFYSFYFSQSFVDLKIIKWNMPLFSTCSLSMTSIKAVTQVFWKWPALKSSFTQMNVTRREQLNLKQSVGFLPQCSWWDPVCHWTKLDHILRFYSSQTSIQYAGHIWLRFSWHLATVCVFDLSFEGRFSLSSEYIQSI